MSEDLSRDPLLGKLASLRPTAAGIDRDEMLFAVGRASAPKAGRWKLATAILAAAQLLTLGLWLTWPRPQPRSGMPARLAEPQFVEPRSGYEPPPADSYGGLVRDWQGDELPPPPTIADPAPSQPILSVAGDRRMFEVN